MHKDWYICEESYNKNQKSVHHISELALDFYNGDPDVLERCAFLVSPLEDTKKKFKNCKGVIGPIEAPNINGQELPHPPHLVDHKSPPAVVLPSCMPVCPVGAMGGAQVGLASAGTSAVTTFSPPGVSSVHTTVTRK